MVALWSKPADVKLIAIALCSAARSPDEVSLFKAVNAVSDQHLSVCNLLLHMLLFIEDEAVLAEVRSPRPLVEYIDLLSQVGLFLYEPYLRRPHASYCQQPIFEQASHGGVVFETRGCQNDCDFSLQCSPQL